MENRLVVTSVDGGKIGEGEGEGEVQTTGCKIGSKMYCIQTFAGRMHTCSSFCRMASHCSRPWLVPRLVFEEPEDDAGRWVRLGNWLQVSLNPYP